MMCSIIVMITWTKKRRGLGEQTHLIKAHHGRMAHQHLPQGQPPSLTTTVRRTHKLRFPPLHVQAEPCHNHHYHHHRPPEHQIIYWRHRCVFHVIIIILIIIILIIIILIIIIIIIIIIILLIILLLLLLLIIIIITHSPDASDPLVPHDGVGALGQAQDHHDEVGAPAREGCPHLHNVRIYDDQRKRMGPRRRREEKVATVIIIMIAAGR
jgi:hypothetical protein